MIYLKDGDGSLMKKVQIIITATIIASILIMPAVATTAATATCSAANTLPGGTAEFTVGVVGNPGLAAWMFELTWDPDVFALSQSGTDTVKAGSVFPDGTLVYNAKESGKLLVNWYRATNASKDGNMFTVHFKTNSAAAPGTYKIGVACSAENTIDENGIPVAITSFDGAVTVTVAGGSTQPGGGTQTGTNGTQFSDVKSNHWAYSDIKKLSEAGVVKGYTDGTFGPDINVSRAEFVTMLAGAAGADVSGYTATKFSDVAADSWCVPYVAWAAENDIVKGTDKGAFSPNTPITREQAATIIWRLTQYLGITLPQTTAKTAFTDEQQIADYAKNAVSTLQQAEIISGLPDGSFAPKGKTTRAAAAVMLSSVMDIIKN